MVSDYAFLLPFLPPDLGAPPSPLARRRPAAMAGQPLPPPSYFLSFPLYPTTTGRKWRARALPLPPPPPLLRARAPPPPPPARRVLALRVLRTLPGLPPPLAPVLLAPLLPPLWPRRTTRPPAPRVPSSRARVPMWRTLPPRLLMPGPPPLPSRSA